MCETRCDGLTIAFSVLVIILVDNVAGQINEEIVKELYSMYRDALSSEPSSSLRRLFKNDREYNIHVQRLKEVNGFKKHNLLIKQVLRSGTDPIIYINNPVESKLPNAFLSIEEFKKIITEKVEKERDEIYKATVNPPKSKLSKKVTKLLKKTSITDNMSLNKNKYEQRTQVLSTFLTTKVNKAKSTQTVSKTHAMKLKTLVVANRTVILKHKSSKISTLETNANNVNSVLSDMTPKVNATLDLIHKHTVKPNIPSANSTTDSSTKVLIINISDSYSKELIESKLVANKDGTFETTITTVDESTNNSSVSFTSELMPDEKIKVERSSNMTTTELAAQEEMKSEISIISTQTTMPTTTKSKRRTLGRPMVFLGR